jgi:uncharacterized protein YdeI (YjbR/CyaY-like superfamily)
MGGRLIVGISAANRAASGIAEGDVVEVGLRLDAEPRVVAEPPDLADVLDRAPQARAAFDRLPMASSASTCGPSRTPRALQTRQRRIAKLITTIDGGHGA